MASGKIEHNSILRLYDTTVHALGANLKWSYSNDYKKVKCYLEFISGTAVNVNISHWTTLYTPLPAPKHTFYFLYSQLNTGNVYHGRIEYDGQMSLYSPTQYSGEIYFSPFEYEVA